ncbi:sulfatase [Jiulongibacter sediminis]|uniref:Iduronate-2-sulfatase n=1 Tax=Jiulongibacter sediminis TaxID=1605367 RepID=A0A0P7BAR1_9BACT|nr:sulfatase [Jiulongibacter sediminis]KPM47506.1 iduronate-2-sulfatase [Jiulongibacter sediminis]TBX23300.1 iduronate-2-sulfatase [Jiulongibacter sediminis]
MTSIKPANLLFLFLLGFFACKPEEERAKNVLLICIDDLRPELKSFGATHISSPNIDGLAAKGFAFKSHYVNAPSCGPSRYTLLTGRYGPAGNYALFQRSKVEDSLRYATMPEWFRNHGYTTVSVGKVSHHPGGRGGDDWNDESVIEMPNAWDKHLMPVAEWQHPRGTMHGLANGEIRVKESKMDVYQSAEGGDEIYPDGLITEEALNQLSELSRKDQPFFLAVGLIKPHLPFGAPKKYYDLYEEVKFPETKHPEKPEGRTTWHGSGEFRQYNMWGQEANEDEDFALELKKHYATCISYADAQVGKILQKLKETGADKKTIVVLWGDHGWHLGEHAIWGKHSLFEESLHSPLIIFDPEAQSPGETAEIVETLDIFPTLCELTNLPKPDFVHGESLSLFLSDKNVSGHSAYGYISNAQTMRNDQYRFILHEDGFAELYDHLSSEGETQNIAIANPALVEEFSKLIENRLGIRDEYNTDE